MDVYRDLGPSDRSPIHEVLAGSAIFLESPKPREQSRELKARLKKLQELEKQYDELVQDITKQTEEKEHFSSYKDQLGFGLYVAVTMIIGFAFGYTVFSSLFRETPALHAAGGALGLIAVMVMEALLFIVRDVQRDLKARLKKLQELEKQYDELVQDITKQTEEKEHFSSYKDQLGFGLYVAVTMIIGFAFGYTVFSSLFRETPALHAAGGALGLIAVMVMEALLFIVRDV